MAVINAVHVACAHTDPKRSLTRLRPTDREYASGLAGIVSQKLPTGTRTEIESVCLTQTATRSSIYTA